MECLNIRVEKHDIEYLIAHLMAPVLLQGYFPWRVTQEVLQNFERIYREITLKYGPSCFRLDPGFPNLWGLQHYYCSTCLQSASCTSKMSGICPNFLISTTATCFLQYTIILACNRTFDCLCASCSALNHSSPN